jgi:hypothetical protein
MYTHTHIYIYICIFIICMYVCMYICVTSINHAEFPTLLLTNKYPENTEGTIRRKQGGGRGGRKRERRREEREGEKGGSLSPSSSNCW